MDIGRLLKWVVIVGVIVFAWKVVLPWAKSQAAGPGTGAGTDVASRSPCTSQAERASASWGEGLGRFVNPPYDLESWSQFRAGVDEKISGAETACGCAEQSCRNTLDALSDLRGLVAEFDATIRNGSSPPDDAVGRQERIDDRIAAAAALVPAGR